LISKITLFLSSLRDILNVTRHPRLIYPRFYMQMSPASTHSLTHSEIDGCRSLVDLVTSETPAISKRVFGSLQF